MSKGARREARRALTNVPLLLGLTGIVAIAVMALFGPQLAPTDPHAQRSVIFYPDSSFKIVPTPPDQFNLLGTDPLGRDQLSRLLWGARLTLTIVVLGLAGRAVLGIGLGLLAGWRSGTAVDHVISRLTDAAGGVPQLLLALLLVIALGGHGVTGFAAALALVGWSEMSRFVRAEVIRVSKLPHLEAARALGGSEGHVVRTHVLRDLVPQLLGVLALEAGSVLLVLAELGFIGFFIAGGIADVSFAGTPVIPARDRAPEWGQMLAGARQYAFRDQYVAFVPGLVVVGAVLAFNLFAEGLRQASDPFSSKALSPRTLGGIARGLGAAGLLAVVGFGYVSISGSEITFEEGLVAANEAALRAMPDRQLVATVVAFSSSAHGLARPERITYYYRDARSRLLRVSFIDADANAIDLKLHQNDDQIPTDPLRPIEPDEAIGWDEALRRAEARGGTRHRARGLTWSIRIVHEHVATDVRPVYRVGYGGPGNTEFQFRMDALNGLAVTGP